MDKVKLNLTRKTPEEVLLGFIAAWQACKWQEMLPFIQKSWVYLCETQGASVIERLKNTFSYRLLEAEVLDAQLLNNVVYVITLKVKFNIARGVSKEVEIEARLISEVAPMTPAPNGEWGVVPSTMIVS